MKRKVCLICALLMSAFIFAAGGKWNAIDIAYPKKLAKIIENYSLTKTYNDEAIEVYKNPDNSDWMYLYRAGSEENKDQSVWLIAFAYLDGRFDSCTFYSGYTSPKESVKYLTACIKEDNTAAPKSDFLGRSQYVWTNPSGLFYTMCRNRIATFMNMLSIQSIIELPYNDDFNEKVLPKYEYFAEWFIEHKTDKEIVKNFEKEYKKYLKEHK